MVFGTRGLWIAVVAVLLLAAQPSSAYVVTEVGPAAGGNPGDLCEIEGGTTCQPYYEVSELVAGDEFDMYWALDGSQILGPDTVPDFPTLAGSATLTVSSITLTQVVLSVTVLNETQALLNPVGFEAGIVSWGAELGGFNSGSLSTAGTSLDFYDTNNIAGGPGLTVDFCASTDSACNAGSMAEGIQIGASDTIGFTLDGTFDPTGGITLGNFATKWQTNYDELVTPDDPDVIAGNSSFEQPGLPGSVLPEPSTGVLLLAGILVGLRGRRGSRTS